METVGKPILCKAAVCRNAGEPLEMEQVWVAPPKQREVRIKIICTSLCHSDVLLWKLKVFATMVTWRDLERMMESPKCLCVSRDCKKSPLMLPHHPDCKTWFPGLTQICIFPRIFGHEAIGIVESVGDDVHEVKKGDTVIPTFAPDCGECRDCKSQKSNKCTKLPFHISHWMPRDGTSRFTDSNGETIYHTINVSSFSEYTVVDVAHVTKVDPSVRPDRACLLSCGISTGVGAALKTAKVEAGSTVAIFGIGAIGLAVAEGARICGATRIIGVDVNPDKFVIGKKFGVTDFINSKECGDKPVSEMIIEMTDGGADYCFECVGMASLVHEAFASCRKGWGKTIVLGVDPKSQLSISSYEILHYGKTLMGSFFGDVKAKTDIPLLIQRYMNKELNLDDFVTHEVKFEEINKAFDLLLHGKSIRCVIWMDK